MNIVIVHAHTANRGDEAAVKSMIDELLKCYPKANITIVMNGKTKYPNMDQSIKMINRYPNIKNIQEVFEFMILTIFGINIVSSREGKEYLKYIQESNLIIHAPGGPSIGDIYIKKELLYLLTLNYIRKLKKKYMFYAPSMGPFKNKFNNIIRGKILKDAECILVRDPISFNYLKTFLPDLIVIQAMDSALQHDIDEDKYKLILEKENKLLNYMEQFDKCLGITITDLKWHPKYSNTDICEKIENTFKRFIQEKIDEGYGIIFIPQLYGTGNDTKIMNKYMISNRTFMLSSDECYDSYFQQFLISKLYAVIGMRYHSNIFSAKMGVPFVSISYEQKMKGFMEYLDLIEYCIDVQELSATELNLRFDLLLSKYEEYRNKLNFLKSKMKTESYKSTEAVVKILGENTERREHC